MALLMSQKAYAERHGVLPSAVSNWKKRELLVFAQDAKGRMLVDAEKSDLLVRGTIDQTRGRPRSSEEEQAGGEAPASPTQPRMSSLEAGRLEEMEQRTLSRRIENQQKLGQLVPLAEFERRAGDSGRLVRERTVALIRQLSEPLAEESDPRKVVAILDTAFEQMFANLADEIEAQASQEQAADAAFAEVEAAAEEEDLEPEG